MTRGPRPSTDRTMTISDRISKSEITLTPGTDEVSDYQQYLQKNSPESSRGDASLVPVPPTANEETQRQDFSVATPTPTHDKDLGLGVPAPPVFQRISSAHPRKAWNKRPRRTEAARDPHEYPGPLPLSLLTVGICLSVFLVSLDRTIVATV